MTRRSVSTASMIDQVGTAIATADGADFEGPPASLPKAITGVAEAAGPTA